MKVALLPSCRMSEYSRALQIILAAVVALPEDVAGVREMLVTSMNDNGPLGGGHSKKPMSRHYTNEAIDLRTHTIPESKKLAVRAWLAKQLGTEWFTVLLEDPGLPNEHLHIQVKMGKHLPTAV